MATVTISPRFQIVIPEEVRHALKPEAGQKVIIKLEGELAALAPQHPMQAARAMFAGIDTHVPNDPEDWTGANFT